MLAEPVKQVSYVLQPRGKPLYEDESSFGMRMLTKMGWSKDKGLGAKENGSKDFIRVKYKNSSSGMGFQEKDTQWTEHEDQFSKLLDNLKTETTEEDARECESLEEKSKKSRARVHYRKFTRGKDLSQYSEKDLANIFGRKTLKVEKAEEVDPVEESPSTSVLGVNTTTSRMSSADYFREKMNAMESPRKKKKRAREEETEEALPEAETKKLKKRKRNENSGKEFAQENGNLQDQEQKSEETPEHCEKEVPENFSEKEKTKKKRKKNQEILPESVETTQQDETSKKGKKKSNKKQKLVSETSQSSREQKSEEIPQTKATSEEKNPNDALPESSGKETEIPENASLSKKKRKKNKEKILPEEQNIEETTSRSSEGKPPRKSKKQKRVPKVIDVSSEEENMPETSEQSQKTSDTPELTDQNIPKSVSAKKKKKKREQEVFPENNEKESKKKQKLAENPVPEAPEEVPEEPPENLSKVAKPKKTLETDLKKKKKSTSSDKLSPEMEAALAEYSSSGEVIFKLPRNKCDLLLNFDSASLKGSNVHSVIGYRLSEQIDLDIIESHGEGKREASEPQSASQEPRNVENQ